MACISFASDLFLGTNYIAKDWLRVEKTNINEDDDVCG